MKLPITLALMLSVLCLSSSAKAEEGAASDPSMASYEASAGIRYVSSRNRGNRGLVQEYDGRQYDFAEADFALGLWGDQGTFDFGANAINSSDENAYFDLSKGEHVRISGSFDTMTHRTNFRNSGIRLNDQYRVNPMIGHYRDSLQATDRSNGATDGDDLFFRRNETSLRALFDLTTETPSWLMVEYWGEDEKGMTTGKSPATNPSTNVQKANIERATQEIVLAAGLQGDGAGAVYEHVYREYDDNSVVLTTSAVRLDSSSYVVRPRGAKHKMNLDEVKFRFGAPDSAMAYTGQFGRRVRHNIDNGYKLDDYAGSVAAAFNPNPHFAITGKLYARGVQIRENTGWRTILGTQGQVNQLDKNTLRAELQSRYSMEKVHLKAGYKFEMNHRRDAPKEPTFLKNAYYWDGSYFAGDTQNNMVETEDMKHIASLGTSVELPLGMEVEAGIRRYQANRAAYESMPIYQNSGDVSLTAPLPGGFSLMAAADQTREKNNKSNMTFSNGTYTNYMAALNWASKMFDVGINASRQKAKAYSVGYFGAANNYSGANNVINMHRDPGLAYLSKDDTVGLQANARLPKGLTVNGGGSFTRSKGAVAYQQGAPYRTTGITGAVDTVGLVTDLAPNDTQISRGDVRVEYSITKDLSVLASYSVARWTDRLDASKNGHVNVLETGLTAKF